MSDMFSEQYWSKPNGKFIEEILKMTLVKDPPINANLFTTIW